MNDSKIVFRGIVSFCAFFLFVCFTQNGFAQALDSVSGKTIIFTITTGTSPFAKAGKFAIAFSGSDNSYRSFGLAPVVTDSAGTFTYAKSNATTGTLVLNDALGLETATVTFKTPNNGIYSTTLAGTPAKQTGAFFILSGTTPASLVGKVYDSIITGGKAPFAISGHFRLFFQDGTYTIKNIKGAKDSSGTYIATALNGSSQELDLTDSIAGTGTGMLAFSNLTTGIYAFKAGDGYQAGQIREVLPPKITLSPKNLAIVLNKPVSLVVRATGDGPIKYQWFQDGNPIANATNYIFAIRSIKGTNAGNYYVTVSNDGGATNSNAFDLSVIFPPTITTQPVGQTNIVGSPVVLNAAATGTEPLRYQWQANGVNMKGQTNSSLTVTTSKLSNAAYRLVVRNAAGAAVSTATRVLILNPVKITAFPRSYWANTNASVLFSVTATGSAPLHYQWQLDGVNIAGATRPQYIVNKVNSTNTGTYTVVITNLASSTNVSTFVVATASPYDPNNDGQTDLLIQSSDGRLITWFLSGTSFLKAAVLNRGKPIDTALQYCGLADFNHDGKKDLLLQNTNTGALNIWFMDGTNFVGTNVLDSSGVVTSEWKIKSVADFDKNGSPDLLAQNVTNGIVAVFLMDGTNFLYAKPIILVAYDGRYTAYTALGNLDWPVVGVADFHDNSLDPSPDILTEDSDGFLATWSMNQTNFTVLPVESDGAVYILNRGLYLDTNSLTVEITTNDLVSIVPEGFSVFNAVVSTNGPQRYPVGADWKVAAIADFNFDGRSDIIVENSAGQLRIWYQTFASWFGFADLRNRQPIDRRWRVVGPK